ncbi:S9 family peptidase [Simiduia aestuariiviva]|uniref:Dipeptidyl aminopeptidase/acylaminoacyl peptidase n=1 Tax=Simiduia aestuariiviva TaxID=1510459 RepID=A0A839UR43_9GAMM|nr:alpha/beta fold hydrolase [Simiduia aestuariiviva]MBB3168970.1 dipeptidyl aminopeptidase/acylaminoacyl peptidase [Simiduia aestuariiviva]
MNRTLLTQIACMVAAIVTSMVSLAEVSTRTANNGQVILEDIPAVPESIVEDLNRYQNVRSAPVLTWTADGKALYIATRFGDVDQLHRVDKPGGARHQLTFFEEPLGGVSRQPKGSLIAFTMDAGGNEYAQIFLFDPATGKHRMLSDGESRNSPPVWSRDGKHIAFQSTRRNGRSNDIWVMDISTPDIARMILESPDGSWWGPVDFSADGKRLLVQNYVSIADSRVYELNLTSGEKTLLAGSPSKPSLNFAHKYNRDDSGFYLSSNDGFEFAHLVHQGIGKSYRNILTQDIAWDVREFSMDNSRKRAAFSVNENGYNAIYLLDTTRDKFQKVKGLPIGLVGGLKFSPNGKKLSLTLNTAQTPSDTFVLDLKQNPTKHGALTRWTHSEVGGLNTDAFIEPELVHYPTFDKVDGKPREIPAFVYKPKTKGPHPVIISIHGGPEGQYRPAFSSTYQLWLEKLGAAVIAPNVRGSAGYGNTYINLDNGYKREDSVKDIGALLDWIATQPDLDASRVAVFGGSYGGYMVLASAMYYSDRLKAAVDIVGISNFVTFLKNTKSYRRDLRRVEYGDERDPKMHDFLQRISPSNNVEKIKVPMLVVQGENDPRVPVSEAVQIVKALREQGQLVWYMNALNEGHGYRKKENRDLYQQVVVMFFNEHLLKD